VVVATAGRFAWGESPFCNKGVTYRNLMDFVGERVPGGRTALLAALKDEKLHAFAAQTFLPSTFYDTLPTVPICQVASTLCSVSFDDFVRDLSRYSVERDTKGIYRMLLRLVSPAMVMERIPAAAKQYFNFVEATVEKLAPNAYRSRARGVPSLLAQFYMLVTEAFLRHALTLAGARGVQHQWGRPEPDGLRDGVPLVILQREMRWD
jgi:hypothetical protein